MTISQKIGEVGGEIFGIGETKMRLGPGEEELKKKKIGEKIRGWKRNRRKKLVTPFSSSFK